MKSERVQPYFIWKLKKKKIGHLYDGLSEVKFLSSVGVGCNEASSGHLSL